ncbi:MAG: VOC family protein [Bacteroidota bacterium]
MINGGNVTVMVSDMNKAVEFYTGVLGLTMNYRAGDGWAEIAAGDGLTLGLHGAGAHGPQPGTPGALSIGLDVDGTLESEMERLREAGVQFRGPIVENPNQGVRFAFFGDPDGNSLYLCETAKKSS